MNDPPMGPGQHSNSFGVQYSTRHLRPSLQHLEIRPWTRLSPQLSPFLCPLQQPPYPVHPPSLALLAFHLPLLLWSHLPFSPPVSSLLPTWPSLPYHLFERTKRSQTRSISPTGLESKTSACLAATDDTARAAWPPTVVSYHIIVVIKVRTCFCLCGRASGKTQYCKTYLSKARDFLVVLWNFLQFQKTQKRIVES